MKALLDKLHARLGDLWWYSLMIFVACRSGDVIQAFIGLWLVPKYVGPDELGAVLPLQQLSGLFAVPLAIIATVFAKYVNTYATRGEYGKVKCFIRDVLLASIIVFLVCIVVAYLVIPHFYERLNVSAGFLTVLILAAGFTGNIANLFTSALQGLKKFKTMTIQNLISAPIRLATLLVAMPIRALSGYILGQATPPATCSFLAAYSLHKDLRSTPLDTSWRKDLSEIWRYLWPIAICTVLSTIFSTITTTIYRQRLPACESAAYYLLSRFAEIASYVGCSLNMILFPMASEAHEQNKNSASIALNAIKGILFSTLTLSAVFLFLADPLLSLSATWHEYIQYANLLSLLTLVTGLSTAASALAYYELACRRMLATVICLIFAGLQAGFFVCFTGYEFFRGALPDVIVNAIKGLHVATLPHMTWCTLAFTLLLFLALSPIVRRLYKLKNAAATMATKR